MSSSEIQLYMFKPDYDIPDLLLLIPPPAQVQLEQHCPSASTQPEIMLQDVKMLSVNR